MHAKAAVVNLKQLAERFEPSAKIDPAALVSAGLLRNLRERVKVLGVGEPKMGFNLSVHGISDSARQKIENAGGKVEVRDIIPMNG